MQNITAGDKRFWKNGNNVETAKHRYVYDGTGSVVRSIDILNCREYNYYYENGRIIRCTENTVLFNSSGIVISKTLMSKPITFLKEGWEDYLYWQKQVRKTLKRVNALLQDILRGEFEGIGKPELLTGDFIDFLTL